MRVGYLHLGWPHDGVQRYGRMLAAEAARQGVDVVEASARLAEGRAADGRAIRAVCAELAGCDVVHVQYKTKYDHETWGVGLDRVANVRRFLAEVGVPVVATVHDVYPRRSLVDRVRAVVAGRPGVPGAAAPAIGRRLRRVLTGEEAAEAAALRTVLRRSAQVLVCTAAEADRLSGLAARSPVAVIPHFVEPRVVSAGREQARQLLGLGAEPVVTLLGFIHERKGHRLALESLPLLPTVTLVFAGRAAPDAEGFLAELLDRAKELGVGHRLVVTGYLDEAALDLWLAATDVPICPFTFASASGSIATWLSAGRGVVMSDLPQAAELAAVSPAAVRAFAPYAPDALAAAVQACLDGWCELDGRAAAEALSLARVVGEHRAVYQNSILAR